MTTISRARQAAEAFQLLGAIAAIEPHGDGLIHDTFKVTTNASNGRRRFILQRINQKVFGDLSALATNTECVVKHVQQRAIAAQRDPKRAIPTPIYTEEGSHWHQVDGEAWRMSQYIEGTTTVDGNPSVEQAYQIGFTFGRFLDDLADLSHHSLQNTLPGYRDTQRYLSALWQAVSEDPCNRAKDAREEIAYIESRIEQTMQLQNLQRSGLLPTRVIHGDTKLNNVLLDSETGSGVCAIDLDTVMPGLLLHDIGDCVREALVGMHEQPIALSDHDTRVFQALVSGFASSQSQRLNELEASSIVAAVSSIALELGARFLTDYLLGDIYFRTAAPSDNHLRARRHFRLQQTIEANQSRLQSAVQESVRFA